jgi:SAM-dependent methyltransferase
LEQHVSERPDQLPVWTKEYAADEGVPTTNRLDPSGSVVKFFELVEQSNSSGNRKVIDLGCGGGRNALYMASRGYCVTAVDFVESALQRTEQIAVQHDCFGSITCIKSRLGYDLPFIDHYFDLAVDCVTSVSLSKEELSTFEAEVRRILRPSGLFMSYVMADDDGYLADRCNEDGYATIEQTGLVDRCFSEALLRRIYKDWNILRLEKKEKQDHFYNKVYTRRLWWLVARPTRS